MAKAKRKKTPPTKDNSIEITLRQLWEAGEAITRLRKSPDLNSMDAWRLRNLGPALDAAKQAQFELAKKYAPASANGMVSIKPSEQEAFNAEWDIQLDEPLGERVIPTPLARFSEVGLTSDELLTLEFMIIDPEPPGDDDVEPDDDP